MVVGRVRGVGGGEEVQGYAEGGGGLAGDGVEDVAGYWGGHCLGVGRYGEGRVCAGRVWCNDMLLRAGS